ncbi:MAG: CvpA family protein [Gemmobacter sp.]|jgi:membrane protein required for colicin V production
MEGFNIVDAVVAGVIVLSAVLAWSRGIVRESLAILGWVAAAAAALALAAPVEPLVREVPLLGDILRNSCELSRLAAFATVFAVALAVMALITPAIGSFVQGSVLGGLDRALGFLFGVARGALLVAVALIVHDRGFAGTRIAMIDQARSQAVFAGVAASVEATLPADAPAWIVARYETLVGDCLAPR